MVRLGTCIAPRGIPEKEGEDLMKVEMTMPDGNVRTESLKLGDIIRVPLDVGAKAKVKITPNKGCDMGQGPGQIREEEVEGGVAGVVLDARGRPLRTPTDRAVMKKLILKWYKALDMYPKDALDKFEKEVA